MGNMEVSKNDLHIVHISYDEITFFVTDLA